MKKSLATVKIVSEIDIYEKNYGLYVFCVLKIDVFLERHLVTSIRLGWSRVTDMGSKERENKC